MPARKPITKKPQKTAAPNTGLVSLSHWLFKWPAKFALISLGLLFATLALVVLAAFSESPGVVEAVMLVSLATSFVVAIRWAIRKAGDTLLSRRDVLYVTISFAIISAVITALALLVVLSVNMENLMMYQYMMITTSPMAYLALAALGVLFGLYIFGLVVFKFIAIYKYAKACGVPKLKILLSIPGGIAFLGWPAFVADSDKKVQPAISNKAGWLERLVNIIISKPMYGAIALAMIAVLEGFTETTATIATIAALLVLFVFIKIYGLKKLVAQMPKAISTAAILLNIIGLLALGITMNRAPQTQPAEFAFAFEQIEIVNE
jgi:hypothetical protein